MGKIVTGYAPGPGRLQADALPASRLRHLLAATIVLALFGSGAPVRAAETADSPHSFTANVGLVSDYRFRGISQTYSDPAIQGGFDYSHASGLYLGTWASNVSGNLFLDGNGMEWDFYGGYRRPVGPVTLDAGLLYYFYPSARLPTANPPGSTEKYDTLEIYLAASWRWLTAKYSYALTDFFGVQQSTSGNGNSKGSGYVDLSASYPLTDKVSLIAHVGHQGVHNYGDLDYTDWKLGATYDLQGFVLGASWVDTNADDNLYTITDTSGNRSRNLGGSTVVVSINRSF